MDLQLNGKTCLVTGASKGIGAGIGRALGDAGAHVALCARDMDALGDLAEEIRSAGGTALPFYLDVCEVGSMDSVFKTIASEMGGIDVLVNNAGLGDNHPAGEVTEAAWDEMMNVNLKGAFFAAQAAGRIMLAQSSGGRIVNMSSQAGSVGIRDHAVYCATKGGVEQFTRVLALEWGHRGVTVNAVAPTFIYTPGTAKRLDKPEYLQSVLDRLPIGRVGQISDVAGAVIYLASPAGGMVNGHILLVDGGWTAQ